MNYRSIVLTGIVAGLVGSVAIGAGWFLLGWKPNTEKTPPPPVPATVPKPFKEDQGTTFTLTADAEKQLALKTGKVERKPMPRRRAYGGELVVPPGRAVVVSSPLAGTLQVADPVLNATMAICGPIAATLPPSHDAIPVAGKVVHRGRPVLYLLPILDPVGSANLTATRVDADGQVQSATEQLKAAEIALERAKKVLAGGAGSQRMVDEAQALVDVAVKTLEAATTRRNLLARVVGELESGGAAPVVIDAPADGFLRTVSALPGQSVPAGAALFEVVNLDQVWVRVPVYVGELPDIDPKHSAEIGSMTDRTGDPTRTASPVSALPAANPLTGTADLFYSLDNRRCIFEEAIMGFGACTISHRDVLYSPGERVGVSVALKGSATSLTVPWAAVVYDYHGGAWVYQKTADKTYSRRRVIVWFVTGRTAVLTDGPPVGTEVVTDGAAELFGTETGFSK
ncbi:MAG: efflux RND transporter periplasmic adaptor subunit [Planctomycetes bacterium]|nr:efflux RND transporter periplasmic adaptor subunit [Planctomycetota bacterium]